MGTRTTLQIEKLKHPDGRLFLPPKDRARAKATGQVSIQSLLGHSPDRADSLVLAVHMLKAAPTKPREPWGGVISSGPRMRSHFVFGRVWN